jgi:hypothetical protein
VLDFILKVAIIIAAGRRGQRTIILTDIKEAMDVVLPLVVPTQRVVNTVKKNDNTLVTKRAQVLTYLTNCPDFKCERTRLLQSLGLQIDHEDLDKISQFMIQMGVLTIDNHAGVTTYRLRVDRPEVQAWIQQYRAH